MTEIIYPDESYAIMGACFRVYEEKGCGFNEAVYQECLEIELGLSGIPFAAQQEINLNYRGHPLHSKYRADFVCYGKILIEIKAVSKLVDEHRAQVINYLNATGFKLGLLVNFGNYPKVQYERFAH